MWKKVRPKSVVLLSQKKLQGLEKKNFSKKTFFQLICVDIIFKMVCGNFFKQMDLDLSLSDFKVPKNCYS